MHRPLRISVQPFAPAGLFLLFFAAPRPYLFAVLSTVFLHELGHLSAASLFGRDPRGITVLPTGIRIELPPPASYLEELTVAAAGPLMNLLYATLTFLFPSPLRETVQTVSLCLAFLNLLPLATFDGGRILSAAVCLLFGDEAARRCLAVTGAVCLSVLWVLSLYILFYSGINGALLFFCAYLFSFFILKKGEDG